MDYLILLLPLCLLTSGGSICRNIEQVDRLDKLEYTSTESDTCKDKIVRETYEVLTSVDVQ
jgi:hypothetical protein